MGTMRAKFFQAASKFADSTHRQGFWEVWPRYEARRLKGGVRCVVAAEPQEDDLPPRVGLDEALKKTNGVVRAGSPEEALLRKAMKRPAARKPVAYSPLADYPDLFIRFARLADEAGLDGATTPDVLDTEKNADAAVQWAEKYGALGLTFEEKDGVRGASTRGGSADTVPAFAAEAWTAHVCLRLYETATADELDADFVTSYMPRRRRAIYTATPAATREWALSEVARATQERVRGNAFPALYGRVGNLAQGWDFMNLLGAMWLQMFWLLTAGEVPRRCASWECDKIIAFEQPNQYMQSVSKNDRSTGYRTREDKRFCSKKCNNRHTYLTRTKQRRRDSRNV